MGRRSINTTKSGKFMNPTDQARKEARKKELKKNKKQRQMVRAAVLKGKDPNHLIGEMEKIDRMEYDVNNPPLLNEKVLKDKRKKLRETFARVMKLYEKEDPDQYKELRKLEGEYEVKRNFLMQYYESVKHAQQVQVEDIPLPSMQMPSLLTSQIPLPSDIPLPTTAQQPTHSILKKTSIYEQIRDYVDANQWNKVKMPPGVPPGMPPPLSDAEDDDGDDGDVEMGDANKDDVQSGANNSEKTRKIRFADDDATVDDDKDTRLTMSKSGRRGALESSDSGSGRGGGESLARSASKGGEIRPGNMGPLPPTLPPGLPPGPPPGLPPGPPPGLPPMMFRPPPLRPPVRLPPGPPPGRPPGPPGHHPGMPPRMLGPPPNRLPPGPPPGMPPPRMLMRPPGLPPANMPHQLGLQQSMAQTGATSVLSAPPSLISRPKSDDEHKKSATIEAKPQIRNLSADVTRFMPTSLRVKREERIKKREHKPLPLGISDDISISMMKMAPIAAPTKDDAYDQFMREMEDLL